MNKEHAKCIVNNLANDLNICFHWKNEFNILFPLENLQYDLFNEIAPNFFFQLNKLFFDYFFLQISKMLDPAKIGAFENLSLYQLIDISTELYPDKREIFKDKIDAIKNEADKILAARKKVTAHRDKDTSINNINLDEIKFSEIESILIRMSELINEALDLLGEETRSFLWFRDEKGSTSLIYALKQSRFYNDICKEKVVEDLIKKVEIESKYYRL